MLKPIWWVFVIDAWLRFHDSHLMGPHPKLIHQDGQKKYPSPPSLQKDLTFQGYGMPVPIFQKGH